MFVYAAGKKRPAALAFHGKATKPDWHQVFSDEAAREKAVRRHLESYRPAATRRAERRVLASKPHGLEVGHVLVASWGYDQTNVDFYQVTGLFGRCMVEVRAIAQADGSTGKESWSTGKAMPALDAYKGEPLRRRVGGQRRTVRIDDVRTAHVWDGRPKSWTAYA
ncbi:hypothetical protein [Lichenihabitans psoromatis]|uniref:hypothetical protein n=1 Tax=Lichenihabitans psoromatis TaxID=2528642 RepID=UPI001FE00F3F|nr:hypothetical protein [Lichenihabitans psoromatis]